MYSSHTRKPLLDEYLIKRATSVKPLISPVTLTITPYSTDRHTLIKITLFKKSPQPYPSVPLIFITSTTDRQWIQLESNAECDRDGGEVYQSKRSGKVSGLIACQKACRAEAGCQSITYYHSGWCSLFSTACTKRKIAKGAIKSMLWAGTSTVTATDSTTTTTTYIHAHTHTHTHTHKYTRRCTYAYAPRYIAAPI